MRGRQRFGERSVGFGRTWFTLLATVDEPHWAVNSFCKGDEAKSESKQSNSLGGSWNPAPKHVFFSACDSSGPTGLAETVVREGLPAAVGFHSAVRDDVQRAFVDEYYRELLMGRSVGAAMAWARQARRTDQRWWAPVLVTGCPSLRMRPATHLNHKLIFRRTIFPPSRIDLSDEGTSLPFFDASCLRRGVAW